MDGMRWHTNSFASDDGYASASEHIEIPPTSTIGQISLSGNYDHTDPNLGSTAFTSCEFIDDDGVQRTQQLSGASFSRNKMVRVDFSVFVDSGATDYIVNLFFWPDVS